MNVYKCSSCKKEFKSKRGGYCTDCNREYQRVWRKGNPKKIYKFDCVECHKEYEAKSRGRRYCDNCIIIRRHRISQMSKRHGITLKKYQEILEQQNKLCAICKRECDRFPNLSVDHDHLCCPGSVRKSCGNCVRGLLCNNCNLMLGYAKDDIERLYRAIEYLQ